jgi:hypothetical protein
MVSERSKSAAAKKKNNTSAPQKKPRLYYNKQLGNTSEERNSNTIRPKACSRHQSSKVHQWPQLDNLSNPHTRERVSSHIQTYYLV